MLSLLRTLAFAISALAVACTSNPSTPSTTDASAPTTTESDAAVSTDVTWRALFEDLGAPVLSVWGSTPEHVFFVGEHGLVLERDADTWIRWEVPTTESLWWVWGRSQNDVYAGGEHGTLLHFDGARWRPLEIGLDPEETVWGIWGTGDVMWLVGGRARTNGPGLIYRSDANGWSRLDIGEQPNLYKVWGRSEDEIYVVGDESSLYQLTDKLEELDLGKAGSSPEPLFTISGNITDTVFAVGGMTQGIAFEKAANGFEEVPFDTAGLNGVSVNQAGDVVVVGMFGVIRERVQGQWFERDLFGTRHYHATLAFDGGAYAVGGDLFLSGSKRRGLIVARSDVPAGDVSALEVRSGQLFLDAGTALDASVKDASTSPAKNGDTPNPQEAGSPTQAPTEGGSSPPAPADAAISNPDPFDAATPTSPSNDAGSTDVPDAAPVEAGSTLPGASEVCTSELGCADGSECWYIEGENEARCVVQCDDASQCPSAFGTNPSCIVPGCQTTVTVCLREEWTGCPFF